MRLKKLCALLLAVALTLGLCSCGLSKEEKYDKAVADVKTGKYDRAIEAFESLKGYEDSEKYIMYARCLKTGDSGDYDTAIKSLTSLGDFKEAAMYIKYYTALAYEADESYEKAAAVYDEILLFKDVQTRVAALPDKILDRDLAEAERKIEEDDYDGWRELNKLVSKKYTSSETRMYENIMTYAAQMHEKQEYEVAARLYLMVKEEGYEKANDRFKESSYQCARAWMTDGEYRSARNVIVEYLSDYKDANELAKECNYQLALETEAGGAQNAQAAYDAFKALGAYKDSAERVAAYETKYNDAVSKEKAGEFDTAIALFAELGNYSDSSEWVIEAQNAKAYAAAASLMDSEKYEEAYAIYWTILEYKDVSEIIQNDEGFSAIVAHINEFQAGNYVTFGSYPQTEAGNDDTPIEWLVLENDGETALLISRYALDCKPYNGERETTTWEQCTLRNWLNNEFFNKAFSAEEKQSILQSDVSADKNPRYDTNPGNATKDMVFLLSVVEANKYFESDDARMCAPTDYAIQQRAYTSDSDKVEGRKACWWWLRSPGSLSSIAAGVYTDGSIDRSGVINSRGAVRPCVRVRLF